MILHAGLVAVYSPGGWRGVLIQGASGTGKSDLALRLIAGGWRLVADDRVLVWRSAGRLFGRAPRVLNDLIEARGIGVLSSPALPFAPIALVLEHDPSPERAPEPAWRDMEGGRTPLLRLNLLSAGSAAQLRLALASDRAPHGLDSVAGGRI